jgi:hypothetical protein
LPLGVCRFPNSYEPVPQLRKVAHGLTPQALHRAG